MIIVRNTLKIINDPYYRGIPSIKDINVKTLSSLTLLLLTLINLYYYEKLSLFMIGREKNSNENLREKKEISILKNYFLFAMQAFIKAVKSGCGRSG